MLVKVPFSDTKFWLFFSVISVLNTVGVPMCAQKAFEECFDRCDREENFEEKQFENLEI